MDQFTRPVHQCRDFKGVGRTPRPVPEHPQSWQPPRSDHEEVVDPDKITISGMGTRNITLRLQHIPNISVTVFHRLLVSYVIRRACWSSYRVARISCVAPLLPPSTVCRLSVVPVPLFATTATTTGRFNLQRHIFHFYWPLFDGVLKISVACCWERGQRPTAEQNQIKINSILSPPTVQPTILSTASQSQLVELTAISMVVGPQLLTPRWCPKSAMPSREEHNLSSSVGIYHAEFHSGGEQDSCALQLLHYVVNVLYTYDE